MTVICETLPQSEILENSKKLKYPKIQNVRNSQISLNISLSQQPTTRHCINSTLYNFSRVNTRSKRVLRTTNKLVTRQLAVLRSKKTNDADKRWYQFHHSQKRRDRGGHFI